MEMEQLSNKVVARYIDNRVVKGYTDDFEPDKPHFHLVPAVANQPRGTEVEVRDLKAVFFVRDFAGDPHYNERKRFVGGERPPGRKVQVTFMDGEMLVGNTTADYAPGRLGFFFSPADPYSNNLRVFAVTEAVRDLRYL